MDLEINGIRYQGFTSASVKASIDEVARSFSFSATSDELSNFPIKQFSDCRVYIDNEIILTGYVEIIDVSFSNSSHDISVQGRSKTSVLVDSSVWDKRTFKKPINLSTIANKIISDLGSDIFVINEFGIIDDFKKDVNAEIGESAFSFLEKLARQKQVLLTTNGFGDLLLARGSSSRINTILLNQKGNNENNILSASINFDTSKRYGSYKVLGQQQEDEVILNKNQTVVAGNSSDSDALSEKKLIVVAEEGIDLKTAKDRADWESNIRRAQSVKYNCKVQGHVHGNFPFDDIWRENTLVRVVDDYANIDSDMLIRSVEYTLENGGSFTNLELVTPDAYSLENSIPTFTKKVTELNWGD